MICQNHWRIRSAHHRFSPSTINLWIIHSLLVEASTFLFRLELLDLVATAPEADDDDEEEKTLGARSLLPVPAVGRMNRLGSGSLFS